MATLRLYHDGEMALGPREPTKGFAAHFSDLISSVSELSVVERE